MRFSNLCPLWSEIFRDWNKYNFNTRAQIKENLNNDARCVVAEAWSFSNEYAIPSSGAYCRECHYLGYCFSYTINGGAHSLDREMWKDKARRFRKHFEKFHLEKQIKMVQVLRKRHV